jgi:hypothetical protein
MTGRGNYGPFWAFVDFYYHKKENQMQSDSEPTIKPRTSHNITLRSEVVFIVFMAWVQTRGGFRPMAYS